MAEVAIPRNLFANILQMIAELRPPAVIIPIKSASWAGVSFNEPSTIGATRTCLSRAAWRTGRARRGRYDDSQRHATHAHPAHRALGRDAAPSCSGVVHIAFDAYERLGLREFMAFEAQYTLRQIAVYTSTLTTGRPAMALPGPDFHRLKLASSAGTP
jgi:hypothetical protein